MSGYRDPLKAGVLSAAVPGAGHVYGGDPARGLTFFLGVGVGLFLFVVPGVLIWLAAIGDAVLMVRHRNERVSPLDLPLESSPLSFRPISISDGLAPTPGRHESAAPREDSRPTAP